MSHLVIDIGTSSIRACIVRPDATITNERRVPFLPSTPFAGLMEFDPLAMARTAVEVAQAVLADAGPVDGLGITNQRASTVVWNANTCEPVGPGLGWQDLRTVGDCLTLKAQGISMAPNASATKVAHLLNLVDAQRADESLRFGTIDSWLVWYLTEGAEHVIDATNAGVTAMSHTRPDGTLVWNPEILSALNIPAWTLPRIVDSSGVVAEATKLGGVPIAAIVGDQQASLVGQGCVLDGDAKVTFGTGGMLDVVGGGSPGAAAGSSRNPGGTFPIITRQVGGVVTWGVEAVMLSAGTSVEWLRDDLGIIASSAESADVAGRCDDTGGVMFVPALLGLGAPSWDYGARGTLVGMTRGTGRPEIVRAVLEGVAHRGADLVEAAETDSALTISSLRVDGGMSANSVFVQALADAAQRPVEVSPVLEATALGAGLLAGVADGTWPSIESLRATWKPAKVVEPRPAGDARERWKDATSRAAGWIPALSALDF